MRKRIIVSSMLALPLAVAFLPKQASAKVFVPPPPIVYPLPILPPPSMMSPPSMVSPPPIVPQQIWIPGFLYYSSHHRYWIPGHYEYR